MTKYSTEDLLKLFQILTENYSESELKTLCFMLGVEYDGLEGEGKSNKARELVAYLNRRDRVSELEVIILKDRPNVSWLKDNADVFRLPIQSEAESKLIDANKSALRDYIKQFPILEQYYQDMKEGRDVPIRYRDTILGIQRTIETPIHPSYVAILGSRLDDHPNRKELCEFVGTILGRSGRILIHGSGDVGCEVAKAYYAINPKPTHILNYTINKNIRFILGSMVYFENLNEMRRVMTKNADFCIAIGGSSGTATEIKMAKERGIEVYSFKEDLVA